MQFSDSGCRCRIFVRSENSLLASGHFDYKNNYRIPPAVANWLIMTITLNLTNPNSSNPYSIPTLTQP